MKSIPINRNKLKKETKKYSLDDGGLNLILNYTNGYAIFMLNAFGEIASWNVGGERLTSYTLDDLQKQNYRILFSKIELNKRTPENTLISARKRGVCRIDAIFRKKDGTFFIANATISFVKGSKKQKECFVVIMEDVTKIKELDRQKEEYIGMVSHEIKTPISTISLYSQLLAERLNLASDSEALKMTQIIQSQNSRLVGLVDDLLAMNQIERDKLTIDSKIFDINKVVRNVCGNMELINTTHKIICQGKIKGKVMGDEKRIEQVIVNLISNGIKYSPLARSIVVRLTEEKKKAMVEVRDFGPGISKNDQKNIFKRFYRSHNLQSLHASGLGLGLYISKEIINKHKEKIWVASKKGAGCRFYFTLPIEK